MLLMTFATLDYGNTSDDKLLREMKILIKKNVSPIDSKNMAIKQSIRFNRYQSAELLLSIEKVRETVSVSDLVGLTYDLKDGKMINLIMNVFNLKEKLDTKIMRAMILNLSINEKKIKVLKRVVEEKMSPVNFSENLPLLLAIENKNKKGVDYLASLTAVQFGAFAAFQAGSVGNEWQREYMGSFSRKNNK